MPTARKTQQWVIPPKENAEFAAAMEGVLDVYERPFDADCPVVCMDEQPVQLIEDTRDPIGAAPGRPKRMDYEYKRGGVVSVFLFSEPLKGWRRATARTKRRKLEWAEEVAAALEGRYANCPKVTLVCDNLNTHTKGALYERFEPERARRLARRLEIVYTPKHGSWLNVAECELSAMTRQCLNGRRIGNLKDLRLEVEAWAERTNERQRGVDWQLTVEDARRKIKSIYPQIIS